KKFDVIDPVDGRYDAEGGLCMLFGNMGGKGGVIKVGGVDACMKRFSGKGICFNSDDEGVEGIENGRVGGGEVVVIRYEGGKGGGGMGEMLAGTWCIVGGGLGKDVGLISDGR
ncbi:dihydroxy-acid dehydratase, partial [Staphylococcus aureus]|uniref:dihydroxy-acid dehydratase domain-containing protein n=1 Tax=Staphylococcus aureus TaxID=1280 RepID=UPI0016429BEC